MPNLPITGLTDESSPKYTDLLEMVKDPAGTPLSRKSSRKNWMKRAVAIKTTTYGVTDDDDILIGNSASALTFNLLAGATRGVGLPLTFKNINTGIVTIDGNSTETIDGELTMELAERDSVEIIWTGSGWESI